MGKLLVSMMEVLAVRYMPREIVRAAIVALTTIAIIIFAILISSSLHSAPPEAADSAFMPHYDDGEQYLPAFAETMSGGYILRDYNGLLTVFTLDNPDVPFYRTDVRVRSLQTHDQALLAIGITARDHMHLQQLLDDFTT